MKLRSETMFKNTPEIGLYEKALPNNLPLKQKLMIAKDIGFDFFEISIDESDDKLSRLDWDKKSRLALLDSINETNTPIKTMCLSAHRRFPLGSLDENISSRGLEIMQKAIQFSVDTGIRIIQLAGYDVYYEEGNEKTKQLFIQNLKKSVSMAEKQGVMLAIEVMDSEFINSIKKAMEYVNLINSPWLNVYPDIGNISAWGNNFDEDFESGKGRITGVHIKETKPGVFRDMTFGEGTVDFVKAFSKLSEIDYQGPYLIEMWANESPVDDAVQNIKSSLKWVKNKMSKGGIKIC